MTGSEFKARLAARMREHRVDIARPDPIPLLPPTAAAQIVEGFATTQDVDVDRMSFMPGAISWPEDLTAIPLLVRHDRARIAGRVLALEYQDGRLFVRARVDDPEARRMGGFSVCVTIIESELRGEGRYVHGVILKARLDELTVSDRPANARARITYRRDVTPGDDAHDDILAALGRMKRAIDGLKLAPAKPAPAPQIKSANPLMNIPASTGMIYNRLPEAYRRRPQTEFSKLVARMPIGEEEHV